jgi:hypothetical protein
VGADGVVDAGAEDEMRLSGSKPMLKAPLSVHTITRISGYPGVFPEFRVFFSLRISRFAFAISPRLSGNIVFIGDRYNLYLKIFLQFAKVGCRGPAKSP